MDLALSFVLLVALRVAGAQYPFRNTSLPFDARVKASMSVHASSLPHREDIEREGGGNVSSTANPPHPVAYIPSTAPHLERWLAK